ncbi:hypothetical protein SKAU_G00187400 [Synaphobranchus kaupii]|uniref:Uncharacterized protein n=1 Tax=Synaphobranchus kaupii TaxID=118154 RepID=A0A9Q1IWJ8_SYNKA|nr:hypothetical protein SKAU_G00187400 [Synaphobranchus kaupii]
MADRLQASYGPTLNRMELFKTPRPEYASASPDTEPRTNGAQIFPSHFGSKHRVSGSRHDTNRCPCGKKRSGLVSRQGTLGFVQARTVLRLREDRVLELSEALITASRTLPPFHTCLAPGPSFSGSLSRPNLAPSKESNLWVNVTTVGSRSYRASGSPRRRPAVRGSRDHRHVRRPFWQSSSGNLGGAAVAAGGPRPGKCLSSGSPRNRPEESGYVRAEGEAWKERCPR